MFCGDLLVFLLVFCWCFLVLRGVFVVLVVFRGVLVFFGCVGVFVLFCVVSLGFVVFRGVSWCVKRFVVFAVFWGVVGRFDALSGVLGCFGVFGSCWRALL